MKTFISLSLLILHTSCLQRSNNSLSSLQFPATPPLRMAQSWAVVNQVALKMFTTIAQQTEILAIVPYAQLVEIKRISYENSHYWCKVRYTDSENNIFEGWVSKNALILFANSLEAEISSKRLLKNS